MNKIFFVNRILRQWKFDKSWRLHHKFCQFFIPASSKNRNKRVPHVLNRQQPRKKRADLSGIPPQLMMTVTFLGTSRVWSPIGTQIGPVCRSAGAPSSRHINKGPPRLCMRLSRVQCKKKVKEQRKRERGGGKCWWESFEFVFFSLNSPGVAIEPPQCGKLCGSLFSPRTWQSVHDLKRDVCQAVNGFSDPSSRAL